MKKIILIALTGLFISCNSTSYEVTGEIKGIADGTKVFLEKQDPKTGVVAIDTVKVLKGKFTFEGESKEPEIHLIQVENTQGKIPFVLENGNITVVINKDSITKAKLSGTYNNDELNVYNTGMMKIQKKMMAFQNANMAVMQAASQKQDTVTMNKLRKEYSKFQEEFSEGNYKYIEKSPKSFISVLLIQAMFGEMEPKFDKIKKYYDALDSSVKETKPGKEIKTNLDKINTVAVGQKAPEFSAKNPEGKMVSLKESLGKVTIIDFWASWCAPCRKENPNVVALYNEFHAKGLNIIGVSLDRAGEEAKWKEAIAKDQLTWTQVSNLKFWEEPIAIQYSVKSIPALFVLDASGKIVAKDLRGAELKAKIAELLAK
ncbi:TlpA disulfide reductase family protein [Flavobacterium sp.]|uniref:TlpA disulfide reductase family protein n=1 Tax=Flavobacterium sp. TaxID=239 RepID=UPI00286D7FB4|nr:TlpA disulfide reductase family protein [Flavobacterium sp.]